MTRIRFATLSLLPVLGLLAGCGSPRSRLPELAAIYEQAALDEIRNPVVVIHGILGARLEQRSTGKIVWGAFTSQGIDPETPAGARAISMPLDPPASPFDYQPAAADVYASGPLERLQLSLLYQVISVEVYANIIRTLGAGGYTDEIVAYEPRYADDHYTCFSFFYDWRRDNVENAVQLGAFLTEKRAEVEAGARARITRLRAAGDAHEADRLQAWLDRGVKFDVVAHSMGGLVARYFLRYGAQDLPAADATPEPTWAGAAIIDRMIIVGTPNFGAAEAIEQLYEGYSLSFFLPTFDRAVLGTMPSIYQLLPRTRHRVVRDDFGDAVDVDFLDPDTWITNRWGLLHPESEAVLAWLMPDESDPRRRAQRAEQYLAWCLDRASRFHAALDVVPTAACPIEMFLFAGDAEATPARVRAYRADDGRMRLGFKDASDMVPGDVTVARYSALGDERFGQEYASWLPSPIPWTNVTFLSDDHIGLTKNPHFTNNLLFILLEQEPLRLRRGR